MPALDGLDAATARRMLSTAYLDIVAARTAGERRSGPERERVINYLRRLASAVESYAVFDSRHGGEIRDGAAFVAAEALALVAETTVPPDPEGANPLEVGQRIVQRTALLVEASLLYLIAGFETNGATLLSQELGALPAAAQQDRDLAYMDWALTALVALCRLDTRAGGIDPPADPRELLEVRLASGVRAALLRRLGVAVFLYLAWLRGDTDDGAEMARRELAAIMRVLAAQKADQHADIFHFVRIADAAIAATLPRAVRGIPAPSAEAAPTYRAYLLGRAKGSPRIRSRPILWPAAQEYVARCLPGPHSHAVVSVPTGAGKSFLAEIAVSQGLAAGWALYLVPTNALANQVRRDLERAFETLEGTQVRAFLGGDEYTTLSEEHAAHVPVGTAVVMTPEKCALALRLAPEAFATCRVCVFDECHLLADGTRGVLAELVVSHILALARDCRFVLMSAMMSNPEDVRSWIESASGSAAVVIQRPWRPTRTMRGVVGVDRLQAEEMAQVAWTSLVQPARPRRGKPRRRMPFDAAHVVVANLQGAWSQTGDEEYAVVRLPTSTELAVRREDTGPELDRSGWINGTSAVLTAYLATRKFSVLTFLPSNPHHCFSVARDVDLPSEIVAARPQHDLVGALMVIAEDELGVASAVGELLQRRLSVHTAALLDAEKVASEVAFQDGVTVAMFATGTLAQGLNLPAAVVIIGGTAVGDRREADSPEGRRRTRSQLLNALGRAGRAGFANHGLALVVTDQPIFFQLPPNTQAARQEAAFLVEEDDSTVVDSRLQAFVDAALGGRLDIETASAEELVALSYLPFEPVGDVSAEHILRRSYGLHRRAPSRDADAVRAAAELVRVGREYVQRVAAPEWITTVAYKTGLPFLLCLRVHQALERVRRDGADRPTNLDGWRSLFFQTMALLPPQRAREILGKEVKSPALQVLWSANILGDNPGWNPPARWRQAWAALEQIVALYMAGEPLAVLARRLFAVPADRAVDPGRADGAKPIPRTIHFVNKLLERLGRVAGALVAIDEAAPIATNGQPPPPESSAALSHLPLALRYGCASRDQLAWFRFGIRFRRPAHLLARMFPVPHEIIEDAEVQTWVRQQRSTWLRQHDPDSPPEGGEDPVLVAVRTVLTS
jgi:hypothetical protein